MDYPSIEALAIFMNPGYEVNDNAFQEFERMIDAGTQNGTKVQKTPYLLTVGWNQRQSRLIPVPWRDFSLNGLLLPIGGLKSKNILICYPSVKTNGNHFSSPPDFVELCRDTLIMTIRVCSLCMVKIQLLSPHLKLLISLRSRYVVPPFGISAMLQNS